MSPNIYHVQTSPRVESRSLRRESVYLGQSNPVLGREQISTGNQARRVRQDKDKQEVYVPRLRRFNAPSLMFSLRHGSIIRQDVRSKTSHRQTRKRHIMCVCGRLNEFHLSYFSSDDDCKDISDLSNVGSDPNDVSVLSKVGSDDRKLAKGMAGMELWFSRMWCFFFSIVPFPFRTT